MIGFPQLVMHYKGVVVDPSTVQIVVPQMQTLGAPKLGASVINP